MKRLAFYAPLKAPSHPVPSGDRQIARMLMQALTLGGYEVTLASTLRLFNGRGERAAQRTLEQQAAAEAAQLISRGGIDAWFTYHHYAKAPDFLGSAVSAALGIPYILCEASVAAKHAQGVYRDWHVETSRIISQADRVVALNPKDIDAVAPLLKPGARQVLLPLFLDMAAITSRDNSRTAPPLRLLTVAMMREGAKLRSYLLLADALKQVRAPWTLTVIGGGAAERSVLEAFKDFSNEEVHFRGALPAEEVLAAYAVHDVLVWPAIDEALGMALLEAQAAGVPVVAGYSPGVASIVADGVTGLLPALGDAAAFAAAVETLAANPTLVQQASRAAADKCRTQHSLPAAAKQLRSILDELV